MKTMLLFLVLATLFVSCKTEQLALTPTYNKGGYTFKIHKSRYLAAQDSIYVGGSIFDVNTKELLEVGKIELGCSSSNNLNNYSFRMHNWDIAVPVTAKYVGYLTVETAPFITQAGDSIVVNFYLAPDEKPLLNCEGSFN
ncbi:hypothetical protein [Pontibacter populi]|uniref:Lipoprotein n=1 Tax=Pontibacter populi TaxID=890055 RepID=A0ABV1RQ31_9BACT